MAGKNAWKKKTSLAQVKFEEAQGRMQAAALKHIADYESSSEDEELECENIIGKIVGNYQRTGGRSENLERTKTLLQDSFLTGTATCLICISRIKRTTGIWSCEECFSAFHLVCIQRWAKDSIFQQKQIQDGPVQVSRVLLAWYCPKCRHAYKDGDVPDKYLCFCGKVANPEGQAFLVPHSCGELCDKDLVPACGHKCLLLCHPGPCPPCPVTVTTDCFCGAKRGATRRCSDKKWSCGSPCGKLLSCGKHDCSEACHEGDCKPCPKKSLQKCLCRGEHQLRDCAAPLWRCAKICDKPLSCGNHKCSIACHEGPCDVCPLSKERSCPCGKSKFHLPCTVETPTCQDTCEKLLACGLHQCHQRCHKDSCGTCLEIVEKACRCGLHVKAIQCCKTYACETKCKRLKDCNKHPCNKKCCDGSCSPCEKPCGRTLKCGNHKCPSVCHRGPCYPCAQTESVSCRCGATRTSVACGRRQKTRPPKCPKACLVPPDCHHDKREPHKCHFGDCPPCCQTCGKSRSKCAHPCSARCHSAVLTKVEGQRPSMPWEQTQPQVEVRALPCPDCEVPVQVTCLGLHETTAWPCFRAVPSSCHRPCGRLLTCDNHSCTKECHVLRDPPDAIKAGTTCEQCENPCSKPRPEGCPHECPQPCHPGACPVCKQMLRIKCHCGLNQPYVACGDWSFQERREELQSCGNQCPRCFDCGHRCRANCHSGACPNPELCKRKVKVSCRCRRIKREFACEVVRNGAAAVVECDEVCDERREEKRKELEMVKEQKLKEDEMKNEKELARYKKLFESKKKGRERRFQEEEEEVGFLKKYCFVISSVSVLVASAAALYWFNNVG